MINERDQQDQKPSLDYWGAERRHCNRMIAVIFFGTLSFGTIALRFSDGVYLSQKIIVLSAFVGSTFWIMMYVNYREHVRVNEKEMLGDVTSSNTIIETVKEKFWHLTGVDRENWITHHYSELKTILFPVFYLVLGVILTFS